MSDNLSISSVINVIDGSLKFSNVSEMEPLARLRARKERMNNLLHWEKFIGKATLLTMFEIYESGDWLLEQETNADGSLIGDYSFSDWVDANPSESLSDGYLHDLRLIIERIFDFLKINQLYNKNGAEITPLYLIENITMLKMKRCSQIINGITNDEKIKELIIGLANGEDIEWLKVKQREIFREEIGEFPPFNVKILSIGDNKFEYEVTWKLKESQMNIFRMWALTLANEITSG